MSNSSLSKTFALVSLKSHKYRSSVLCFLPPKIVFIEVHFVSKKILGLKIFWGWTKFCVQKKIFDLKKFFRKFFGVQKNFCFGKKFCAKKMWVNKNLSSEKNFESEKKFGSEKNIGSIKNAGSEKNFGSKKILGQKEFWVLQLDFSMLRYCRFWWSSSCSSCDMGHSDP